MPSVEYHQTNLITETVTREFNDPETGETVTVEVEVEKNPFEVRISKWLERSDGYHLHGFVNVTDFGKELVNADSTMEEVLSEYQVDDSVSEEVIGKWRQAINSVRQNKFDEILSYTNVDVIDTEVKEQNKWRMDFEVVLSGATTFDIEWLAVDFDPTRGGK